MPAGYDVVGISCVLPPVTVMDTAAYVVVGERRVAGNPGPAHAR